MLIFQLIIMELLLEIKKFKMKWKKAQYRGETSFGKKFLIFLIIIFMLIGVSYYFDFINTRNMIKKLFTSGKEKVNDAMSSDTGSSKNKYQPHTPEVNLDWCNTQNIPVDSSETSPISIKILGQNQESNCCIKQVSGYDSCLNKSVNLNYCYTSNIGGKIIYVTIDDKYFSPYYYQQYIKNIHKSYNPFYNPKITCDMAIYN